jgi:hypothetical protein
MFSSSQYLEQFTAGFCSFLSSLSNKSLSAALGWYYGSKMPAQNC